MLREIADCWCIIKFPVFISGTVFFPKRSSAIFRWRTHYCSREVVATVAIHSEKSVGWSGKLLLVFASTVILGSDSRWTHGYILLFHDSGNRVNSERPLGKEVAVLVFI
jgi:hypothetical protein